MRGPCILAVKGQATDHVDPGSYAIENIAGAAISSWSAASWCLVHGRERPFLYEIP
jgi:hypothetical protein